MWAVLDVGYWLSLLLAVPAAGFLVRLFMIQHDCGHGAFFRHRVANDWIGRVIGVLTLTPYDFWRRTHAIHHATSGNLERRGIGDVETLTVNEYLARSKWGRLRYRLYRHPIVMFGLGPAYLFILQYRLPLGLVRAGWKPWLSTMGTNLAIAILVATVIWLMGVRAFLLVELPITLLGASIGVWLFYVQHQFEDTLWAHDETWNQHEATAVHILIYRVFCAGSPPISACTMFITSAAESHTTACLAYSGIIRSSLRPVGSRSLGASSASGWCFGTRVVGGSSRSAMCVSIRGCPHSS